MSRVGATVLLLMFTVGVARTTVRYVREDLLHPLVLLNAVLTYFVLVPAAYLLWTGEFLYGLTTPYATLLWALGVFALIYVIALSAFVRTPSEWSVSSTRSVSAEVDPRLLALLGGAGFVAGIAMFAYYVLVNGGPIRLLTVQPRTAFQTVPETARWRILGLAGVFGGMATVLTAYRARVEGVRRPLTRRDRALLISVVGIAVAVAVSTRARMVIAIPCLAVLLYVYSADLISRRALVGTGSVAIVGAAGFGLVEGVVLGQSRSLVESLVQTNRLQVFMATIVRVPEEVGYQFGATLLRATMLEWPGMPMRTGNLLEIIAVGNDWKARTFSGMMPAELWLNFGLVGVLVFAVLYGVGLRVVYGMRDADDPLVRGAFPFFFLSVLLLLPTNLTWALKSLAVRYLLPILLAAGAVLVVRHNESLREALGGT